MSIYKAYRNQPLNKLNSTAVRHENYKLSPASRNLVNTVSPKTPDSIGTINPIDFKLIKYNENTSAVKQGLNEAEIVRITQDASAIRQEGYLYYDDRFKKGLPYNISYKLCPQKLSSVFANYSKFYSSSYELNEISYKVSSLVSVSEAQASVSRYTTSDCVCFVNEFAGNYYLDWNSPEGKLINTDNGNVSDVSFDFYSSEEYFEIKIYPKLGNSYLWIRYRIPVRYRYAYSDWVFMENLVINGEMTETEFVKIVNCCDSDPTTVLSV